VEPPDLDHRLIDNFQAAAVILAVATVFFGIQYQAILDASAKAVPEGPAARKHAAAVLKAVLLYRLLPLWAASGASSFLFFPSVLEIAHTSQFSLLDFDFIRTAWVLTCAFLLAAFIWTCIQATRIAGIILRTR
jgi:hypothetical protein